MDSLGNALSHADLISLEGINAFVHGFLSYESTATNVLSAADANISSAIANAYAGFIFMFLEAPDAPEKSSKYLKVCEGIPDSQSNHRGKQHVAILKAWISDDIPSVLNIINTAVDTYPRDLVLVKLYQYLAFNMGQFEDMLDITLKVLPSCKDICYLHGMLAFAYEQCHDLDQAEKSARYALQLESKEPWAEHALAHVMLTQGRINEGLDFLEAASSYWTGLNSFMSTHLWWHLALFHISRGHFKKALEIYDNHVWGVSKDYSQDQINAISLLARLELAGAVEDIGESLDGRWEDVATYLVVRSTDTTQPFHSLHYLLGLCRSHNCKQEVDRLLGAIKSRSETAPSFVKLAWEEAALPASVGIVAWINDDATSAVTNLSRALCHMQSVGGSHAQRDLFEQIYLAALIQSRNIDLAIEIINKRLIHDPESIPFTRLKLKLTKADC